MIREITPADNEEIAIVIRKVLIEFGVPKVGTAYADKVLDCMYETYDKPTSVYFVVDDNGKLIGGAGIAQLDNYDGNVCELQKMYFHNSMRGKGYGSIMIDMCLEFARKVKFEKCYIETMPNMIDAQKLYIKKGFKYIDKPLGNTGHAL